MKAHKNHNLKEWEIALVKAMLKQQPRSKDQDILCYFTRPSRSVNHRVIAEIRRNAKHESVEACSDAVLDEFLDGWPHIDPETGLHLIEDELILKAREAMIAAVHTYNSAGLTFRAELFIVTIVIAWTYILHAWYKRQGTDYRYYKNENGVKTLEKTKGGEPKYWELRRCLSEPTCPLEQGIKNNLLFLLVIRHEIEHRCTSRIDTDLSAKLQATCINFNDFIKREFGEFLNLEGRLSIALQFSGFNTTQKDSLKRVSTLPRHIETTIARFQANLSSDEYADQKYAYRVAVVQKTVNQKTAADEVVEFVKGDSQDWQDINRILLKEVEKPKYRPGQVVELMQREGYPLFSIKNHTDLWKAKNAKRPDAGYGAMILGKQWVWYENWVEIVRQHCLDNKDIYRAKTATG